MSDNPYDSGRDLGIDHDDQFIPFKSEGSTVFFNSFVPTDADINTFPHMVLTDIEIEWDLQGLEMATNRPYGDNAIRVNSMATGDKRLRVEVEHESDLCLGSISRHLAPDICYEKLINSVTVNSFRHGKIPPKKGGRNMKEFKSHIRHSVITAEHLARKMNIGLEKYKQMIIETTQKGI